MHEGEFGKQVSKVEIRGEIVRQSPATKWFATVEGDPDVWTGIRIKDLHTEHTLNNKPSVVIIIVF